MSEKYPTEMRQDSLQESLRDALHTNWGGDTASSLHLLIIVPIQKPYFEAVVLEMHFKNKYHHLSIFVFIWVSLLLYSKKGRITVCIHCQIHHIFQYSSWHFMWKKVNNLCETFMVGSF